MYDNLLNAVKSMNCISYLLDIDVCILINNAAEFQQQSLIQTPPETLFRASHVNSHAPALLARFFIPQMMHKYDTMVSYNLNWELGWNLYK